MTGDSSKARDGKARKLAVESWAAIRNWLDLQGTRLTTQRDRWVLWLPVALALGITSYHALGHEPPVAVLPIAMALGVAVGFWAFRETRLGFRAVGVGMAAALLGFALAQAQTLRVAAPVLERPTVVELRGSIVLVEPRADGARLTLDVLAMDASRLPDLERVRLTARDLAQGVAVGDEVWVRARLLPPSGPALPGGFDFARWAYFQGLGAVGYALGPIEVASRAEGHGPALWIAEIRRQIAVYAVAELQGDAGGVAAAMLTGLRGDIPDHVWEAMQRAGLAHLLAISGLHLGLVAGTAFILLRYGLCLWPAFALRLPVHRFAAAGALLIAGLYLLLAGATVPTQRAFVMTAIVLSGLMLDREPLSLRLVAIAATAVLVVDPQALFGASFQMSFAAVTALVAFYERRRFSGAGLPGGLIGAYLLGVTITTLVASLATLPFAAFHFGRVAAYGIAANLIAVPAMAAWVMPMGLLTLLLMPFGLAGLPLQVMGTGIEVILAAASRAAAWPGAAFLVPQPPAAVLVLLAAAGIWAAIWRQRLARWALVPALAAALMALTYRPPDLVIATTADRVAVRQPDGGYAVIADRTDRFVEGSWWRMLGVSWGVPFERIQPTAGWRCDPVGCRVEVQGQLVAIARRPNALLLDCEADLLVNLATQDQCASSPTISRDTLQTQGAASLWLGRDTRVRHLWPQGPTRPWHPRP